MKLLGNNTHANGGNVLWSDVAARWLVILDESNVLEVLCPYHERTGSSAAANVVVSGLFSTTLVSVQDQYFRECPTHVLHSQSQIILGSKLHG